MNGQSGNAAGHAMKRPKLRGLFLLGLIVIPVTSAAEAADKLVVHKCAGAYQKATSVGKKWTAFAANRHRDNRQACGWAYDYQTKQEAIRIAMRECKASEHDHPTWGKTGTCRIVYVRLK